MKESNIQNKRQFVGMKATLSMYFLCQYIVRKILCNSNIKLVKLATLVEGNPKPPFSIT